MKQTPSLRSYLIFFLGLEIAALGISLITGAGLGTSPVTSLAYVLSLATPISLGVFTFLVNTLCLLGQALLLGRAFEKRRLFQLPATFLFSFSIDLDIWLLTPILPTAYPAKLAMLLCGCAVLGLGIALEVCSNALILPAEGIVHVASQQFSIAFAKVKTAFDLGTVAIATLVSLAAMGEICGIREGTILAALTVGAFSRLFQRAISNWTIPAPLTRSAVSHSPAL